MRIGRAAQNWDIICPSDEEYEKFFDVLQEKTAAYEGKMKVYYYPYDVIEELKYRLESPSASLLVVPNGKVKLIGPLPFICGDLKKQSLKEIWENYKNAWKKPEVIEFTKKVIAEPKLLAESNNWIEI
jgi:MoaA/NifB/PqqE/SkfB family radical SAM enzyme